MVAQDGVSLTSLTVVAQNGVSLTSLTVVAQNGVSLTSLTVVAQDGLIRAAVVLTHVSVSPVAMVVPGVEARRGTLVTEGGLGQRAVVELGNSARAPAHLALRPGA